MLVITPLPKLGLQYNLHVQPIGCFHLKLDLVTFSLGGEGICKIRLFIFEGIVNAFCYCFFLFCCWFGWFFFCPKALNICKSVELNVYQLHLLFVT